MQRQRSGSQDREVPFSKDLIYTAMRQFPGYDQQTALALYLIDKQEEQNKTDTEQTRLIRSQKQQNDKLTSVVKSIGQELDDLERQSLETDQEIERIKDLSSTLRGAGDVRQEVTKATSEQLKGLEAQLLQVKTQPGIDPQKYKELVSQINDLKSKQGLDPKDVAEIQNVLKSLQGKQGVSDELFNKAMQQLNKTQQELDAKEERFKNYIKDKGDETAQELKQYADEIIKYKQVINSMKDDLPIVKQAKNDILKMRGEIARELEKIGDEQNLLSVQKNLPRNTPQQAAAADATTDTISRVRKPKAIAKELPTSYERDAEMTKHYSNVAGTLDPDMYVKEDIRPAHNYPDVEYVKWLTENLPILVKMFKNKYWEALENKNPTYPDQQIAYVIEDLAPWLWNHEAEILTKDIMDKFLSAVKANLWKQPPEPEQYELPLREGLDKIYENMLDQIIIKSLSKTR